MPIMLIIYTCSSKKDTGKRRNLNYIQEHNYATVTEVCINKNQTLYYASTINVTIRETGSSRPCDHASTVAMSSEIP